MRYVEGVQAKVEKQEVIMNGKKIFFIVSYLLSKYGFGKANVLRCCNFDIFICAWHDINGIACFFYHLRIVCKFYIRIFKLAENFYNQLAFEPLWGRGHPEGVPGYR